MGRKENIMVINFIDMDELWDDIESSATGDRIDIVVAPPTDNDTDGVGVQIVVLDPRWDGVVAYRTYSYIQDGDWHLGSAEDAWLLALGLD